MRYTGRDAIQTQHDAEQIKNNCGRIVVCCGNSALPRPGFASRWTDPEGLSLGFKRPDKEPSVNLLRLEWKPLRGGVGPRRERCHGYAPARPSQRGPTPPRK